MSQDGQRAESTRHDIVITRVFDAPRELVWKTWTDPQHVARWWGPRGFSTRIEQLDVRPGGKTKYVMVGPDGTEYPVGGQFTEVVPFERFTSTDEFGEDFPVAIPAEMLGIMVTCAFEDLGGRTKLTLCISHPSAESLRQHKEMGVVGGWNSSFDCLDDYLAELSPVRIGDCEIQLSRVLAAPREQVWKAWTQPEQIKAWWGPTGFSTSTRSMAVQVGGQWRFVMHGPDGRDYENLITYLEVAEPERLVYKHGGQGDVEPVNFTVTVKFEPIGDAADRTRISMRMVFPSNAARDFVLREYGAAEGARQTMRRLGEHVVQQQCASACAAFEISRALKAPRDLVWRVWTEREHLMRWFGPKETEITRCSLEFRVGGKFHYFLQGKGGDGLWGLWEFREIVQYERLVTTVSFADEHGNITRAPWDENWPMKMWSEITFDDHAGIGGGTVVRIKWTPYQANATETAQFIAAFSSMQQGWGGTLDRLVDYVVERSLS